MDLTCVCDCGDGNGEKPAVYIETFPVARKTHRCCECKEDIKPGKKYHHAKGLWEGEWATFRTCWACYCIRDDYCGCDGWQFGQLREAILECYGFDYTGVWEDDEEED